MQDTVYWKAVPNYEGLYEVSNTGSVRSIDRLHTLHTRWNKSVTRRRQGADKEQRVVKGYCTVRLCKDGRVKTHLVSRLVLSAFDSLADGREAGHKNNNTLDNRLANLCWQTRKENEAQKTEHGRRPLSTRGLFSTATVAAVRDIRAAGFLLKEMAALFGCHYTTIAYICSNKTWSKNGPTFV